MAGELPAEVFPDVPVVFVSVNELEVPGQFRLPGTTGIVQRHDFQGTFELILRLQPDTRRIVVVGGVAPMDQIFIHRAEEVVQPFAGRVQFEFWTNHPVAQLPATAAALPAHTVVCLSTVLRDVSGQNFFPEQVVKSLAPSASVPIYVLSESLLGSGAVGGALVDFNPLGVRSGQLALRVLNGTPPGELPIEVRSSGAPIFDWRALHRWRISEAPCPQEVLCAFVRPRCGRTTRDSFSRHARSFLPKC